MRVCYFGLYDPDYARNQVIRKGLQANGAELVQCRIDTAHGAGQYLALFRRMQATKGRFDAVIVAEHNQFVMPLAWLWSRMRRVPVIFDPFTSLYDSNVFDRQLVTPGSFRARRLYWLDRISMNAADAVLADTGQHQQYFSHTFGVPEDRLHIVPVGADNDLYHPQTSRRRRSGGAEQQEPSRVLFWGNYIPLHGIETILRAASLLRGHSAISIELLGNGQTYRAMRGLAQELDLPATIFRSRVAQSQLPSAIGQADICLGIFGDSAKARRVVPNKVFQALAMRQPVITGDSPAVREFFTPVRHLRTVPMADSAALAEVILDLHRRPGDRDRMADAGYRRYLEGFTPERIGEVVLVMLCRVLQNR
jgi:glycosyltransferase involved in cell wall biosynthesis